MMCVPRHTARALAASLLLGAGLHPGAAAAEIYRWTDAEGRVHFTEQLDRVPPAQRPGARERARSAPPRTINFSGSPAVPAAAAPGAPAGARLRPGQTIEIPFTRDGSLMRVEATVNDQLSLPFLVDTGASGVSLPRAYADRLGLRVGADGQAIRVETANGTVTRPVVQIQSMDVHGARVERLEATVNPLMQVGLLGGDFFNNFIYRVDAAAGIITLTPNENIRGGVGADEWQRRFMAIRDPLARLDAHIRQNPDLRQEELAALAEHRAGLAARLAELEREADRLDVPQIWRD